MKIVNNQRLKNSKLSFKQQIFIFNSTKAESVKITTLIALYVMIIKPIFSFICFSSFKYSSQKSWSGMKNTLNFKIYQINVLRVLSVFFIFKVKLIYNIFDLIVLK